MGPAGPCSRIPVKFLAKCISDHDGEDGPNIHHAAEACGDVSFERFT